jgi:hypothetical protein
MSTIREESTGDPVLPTVHETADDENAAEKAGFKNAVDGKDTEGNSLSEASTLSVQDGVKTIEAVAMSWSKWGLIVAYIG